MPGERGRHCAVVTPVAGVHSISCALFWHPSSWGAQVAPSQPWADGTMVAFGLGREDLTQVLPRASAAKPRDLEEKPEPQVLSGPGCLLGGVWRFPKALVVVRW